MSAEPLIEYLTQLQSKGISHVSVNPQAREVLKLFYMKAVNGALPTPATSPAKQSVTQPLKTSPSRPLAQTRLPVNSPQTVAPRAAKAVTKPILNSSPEFDAFKVKSSTYAPLLQLGTLRETHIFPNHLVAEGIMFVGCAPGYYDELTQAPFSGKTGDKVDGILKAMGLTRTEVYLTNILKFRPRNPNQTKDTRKVSDSEKKAALPLFIQELEIIKPRVIITMGEDTAQLILNSELSIDQLRAKQHTFQNIPVIPTLHPSLLLHQNETKDKRSLWEDMLSAMELMNMPISEKQQGYFSKA